VVRVIDFISEQEALHADDPNGAGPVNPPPPPPAPVSNAGEGAVTQPVSQTTFIEPPPQPQQPIQVQPLPPAQR
jgi:hypothetical protein